MRRPFAYSQQLEEHLLGSLLGFKAVLKQEAAQANDPFVMRTV